MSETECLLPDLPYAELTMRYRVVDGSQSAHCCFEFTVVDGERPVMIHGEHYGNQYEAVCECFDRESADLIAKALNKL